MLTSNYYIFIEIFHNNVQLLGERNVTMEGNRILINIPIHVLNNDKVVAGMKRDIGIVVFLGDDALWETFKEIKIQQYQAPTIEEDGVNITEVSIHSAHST